MKVINAIEYQKACLRTAGAETGEELLLNGILGLSGESGEVADLYKKHRFQGHDLDKEEMVNELGDCMWYIAVIAESLGVTLEDIMQANILKLEKRYPEGFDPQRSVNREDEKEDLSVINDSEETDEEKQILRRLYEDGYLWIARDDDDGISDYGMLVAFKEKPVRDPRSDVWEMSASAKPHGYTEDIPRDILSSVQWYNAEPTLISELLEIKEED